MNENLVPFAASIYDRIMKNSERNTFSFIRKELIALLEGDILEVGCGTGINFQYYSSKCKVLAIEPGRFRKVQYK